MLPGLTYRQEKPHIKGWYRDSTGTWNIRGKHCHLYLNPRPVYCDRGSHLAVVDVLDPFELTIDGADYWPRYYFGLDVAKQQCGIWLLTRKQITASELANSEADERCYPKAENLVANLQHWYP